MEKVNRRLKIALVHDWFIVKGGAERVVEQMLEMVKNHDVEIFTLFYFYEDKDSPINNRRIHTSFLQRVPFAKKFYRYLLPFYPKAIEQFDLRKFDLVLSSSHAVAKNVIAPASVPHICYCHTPMRYAWDMYHDYFSERPSFFILRFYQLSVLHKIRIWDVVGSNRIDAFIANSKFVQQRIQKIYRRNASVIYPPVCTNDFKAFPPKENYYLAAGRFVDYKKFDLIIQAFQKKELQHCRLILLGGGPEEKALKKMAKKSLHITIHTNVSRATWTEIMAKSKAFICSAIEDFGITTVEAQQLGTPVLALRIGGYLETAIEHQTGYFFDEQSSSAIANCVLHFEQHPIIEREQIVAHGNTFNNERFIQEFQSVLEEWI